MTNLAFFKSRIRHIRAQLRWLDAVTNAAVFQISPSFARKLFYFRQMKRRLDLRAPRDFNEKMQWLLANSDLVEFARYADKFHARGLVGEKIGQPFLPQCFGVYDSLEEIPWESLPSKCVLKCTHGCGFNVFVKNRDSLDVSRAKKELQRFLRSNIGFYSLELHYSIIKPRVMVEEYLEGPISGDSLVDYKIYCFDGVPKVVLVCTDRESELKLDFFDTDWRWRPYAKPQFRSSRRIDPPISLPTMLHAAGALAHGFKFVRIDFYEVNGRPVFGEFTFSPAAGVATYYSSQGLAELGEMFVI